VYTNFAQHCTVEESFKYFFYPAGFFLTAEQRGIGKISWCAT